MQTSENSCSIKEVIKCYKVDCVLAAVGLVLCLAVASWFFIKAALIAAFICVGVALLTLHNFKVAYLEMQRLRTDFNE